MVVTNDRDLAEKVRLLRNLAFSKPRFLHQMAGYNFRLTGYQAAMGLAQFRKISLILQEKRRVAETYGRELAGIRGLQLPVEAEWATNVYWMYAVVLSAEAPITRDKLMELLAGEGIESRTFFCPMNLQPFLRKQPGFSDVACPIAESLWLRGLYLPSSPTLADKAIASICKQIRRALTS